MAVFAAIVVGTGVFFYFMPKGYLTSDDVGQMFVFTEAAQDISFDAMANLQRQVANIVRENPHVQDAMSFVGVGGPSAALNAGRIFVTLKPRDERPPADEVVQELRPALMRVQGIKAYVQNVPAIRIGQLTKSAYQYTLQGSDTAELYHWAPLVEAKLRTLPGLVDVNSDLQITQPQVTVDIDRNRASALGVSAQAIENTLYDAYGQRQISTIYGSTDQYWVVMELEPRYQTDPSVLPMLYVRSNTGALVPLNAVATLKPTIGPLAINHLGQLPAVTLSFDLKPGVSLSQAIAQIRQVTAEMQLPVTIRGTFQGAAQAFQASLQGMGILLVLAIFVHLPERHPLRELHPSGDDSVGLIDTAGFGRCVTLWLFGLDSTCTRSSASAAGRYREEEPRSPMIDFSDRRAAQPRQRARSGDLPGVPQRFHPIMMTTMAALMGSLPGRACTRRGGPRAGRWAWLSSAAWSSQR
jgi:HAE1 family hydrophobic/amphiphilic exporter-1